MNYFKQILISFIVILALVTGIFAVAGCGRPKDAELDQTQRNAGDYTPVKGLVAFGSQCPQGTIDPIKPLRVQLWNCPLGTHSIEFSQDLEPIYLQADCRNRILNVRTGNRKIDESWYFLPDGEFDVIVDGLAARLLSDGSGATNCNAPLAINLFGKITCGSGTGLDQATINFQSVMWAGKRLGSSGNSPIVTPSPGPNGLPPPPVYLPAPTSNPCNMPSSCYFFTQTTLKQCQ